VSLVYIASAKPATVQEKIKEIEALIVPEREVDLFFRGIYHTAEILHQKATKAQAMGSSSKLE
jgi:hypothetical protein